MKGIDIDVRDGIACPSSRSSIRSYPPSLEDRHDPNTVHPSAPPWGARHPRPGGRRRDRRRPTRRRRAPRRRPSASPTCSRRPDGDDSLAGGRAARRRGPGRRRGRLAQPDAPRLLRPDRRAVAPHRRDLQRQQPAPGARTSASTAGPTCPGRCARRSSTTTASSTSSPPGGATTPASARGSGPIPAGDGNTMMIGWEIDYNGVNQEMTAAQYNASIAATAAVLTPARPRRQLRPGPPGDQHHRQDRPVLHRPERDARRRGAGDGPAAGSWSSTVDNTTAGRFTASANWGTSAYSGQRYGADYRFANPVAASDAAWYKFAVPATGNYRVEAWWPATPGYNSAAPVHRRHQQRQPDRQRRPAGHRRAVARPGHLHPRRGRRQQGRRQPLDQRHRLRHRRRRPPHPRLTVIS